LSHLGELDFALESTTATGWYNACFTRSVVDVLRTGYRPQVDARAG